MHHNKVNTGLLSEPKSEAIMAEVTSASISPNPERVSPSNSRASSSPPNCAICLGHCINKCYSNSCLHQFCFKCLVEWSKIKAVCPLCQRPFLSIIHNVKSNEEYDQHYVQNVFNDVENSNIWNSTDLALPNVAPFSRSFQFRTTLTVDPSGEWAIQQLLSSHSQSRNSTVYPDPLFRYGNRMGPQRYTGDNSSSAFRRSIYENNHWVSAPSVIHGGFREATPSFFVENPAAKNRLIPWLNREMNALIPNDSMHAMQLVQQILTIIDSHSIRSRRFRELIQRELGEHTNHFIHEFYTYARSPYDMVAYDRHTFFTLGIPSIQLTDVESSDSDVYLVPSENTSNATPTVPLPSWDRDVIEIDSESSRDSDVVVRERTPPVLVDLVASSSDSDRTYLPILPLKLRIKRKKETRKRSRRHSNHRSSDSDSTSSSSNRRPRGSDRKRPKLKYYIVKQEASESDEDYNMYPMPKRSKTSSSKLRKTKLRKTVKRKSPTPSSSSDTEKPVVNVEVSDPPVENVTNAENGEKTDTVIEPVLATTEVPTPFTSTLSWNPEPAVEQPSFSTSEQASVQECDVAGPSGLNKSSTAVWFSRPNYGSDESSD